KPFPAVHNLKLFFYQNIFIESLFSSVASAFSFSVILCIRTNREEHTNAQSTAATAIRIGSAPSHPKAPLSVRMRDAAFAEMWSTSGALKEPNRSYSQQRQIPRK